MTLHYREIQGWVHRLIPSRFPPISFFDWADSADELLAIAALEGLTNDRLLSEYGHIAMVPPKDWVTGMGATPLMAAFTHPGYSRFADDSFGAYYAADSLGTAIAETLFHREQFLSASHEAPCLIQMREYRSHVIKPLVALTLEAHASLLSPDVATYLHGQAFARILRQQGEYGLAYPSVRKADGLCVAIFRPPALTLPQQGCHLDYAWDGTRISVIRKATIYERECIPN